MPHLEALGLESCQVTDKMVSHLKGLTTLRQLSLGGMRITDTELAALKERGGRCNPMDYRTKITDIGLAHLKGLTGLRSLDLRNATTITDAGLAHLKGLHAAPVPAPPQHGDHRRRPGPSQGADIPPGLSGSPLHQDQRCRPGPPQGIDQAPEAGPGRHTGHQCRPGPPQGVDGPSEAGLHITKVTDAGVKDLQKACPS